MAIFDNFPYTNFHELNLDWLIKNMKTLMDKYENIDVDTLKTMLQNYIDEQIALLGNLEHIHTWNSVQYYVDCIDGSNITGDGSAANPYYSVAKALDEMNKTGAGAVIRLMKSGTYTITKAVLAGCAVQFIVMAPNVTLQWLADASSVRPKEARNVQLSITGYYDGTTVFAPNGLADVLLSGSAFELTDCSLVGAQDISLSMMNSMAVFSSTTINMPIVGSQSLITFTDGTVFLESQRSVSHPCIAVEENCVLMLNDSIDTTALTTTLTSAIVAASRGCRLYLEASGFSYGSTLATGIKTMDVRGCDILCGHYASLWLANATWYRVLYNGEFYGNLQYLNGSPMIAGAWNAWQVPAAYNTLYNPPLSVRKLGIKATVTSTGFPDINVQAETSIPGSGTFDVFLGQIGPYLYTLNLSSTLGAVKVVSATQLDVTTGTPIVSQAPEVTFDLYLIP